MTTQFIDKSSDNFLFTVRRDREGLVPVREFSSADELRAHQAALRAKFFPRAPVVAVAAPSLPAPVSEPAPLPVEVSQELREQAEAMSASQAFNASKRVRQIKQECADEFGVTVESIDEPTRTKNVVKARQKAMGRVYQEFCWSLPKIARHFGGRDHTTVLHALKVVGVWAPVRNRIAP